MYIFCTCLQAQKEAEAQHLEAEVQALMGKLEDLDLLGPGDLEKLQLQTDDLMDAVDACHDHGDLEDSRIVKDVSFGVRNTIGFLALILLLYYLIY